MSERATSGWERADHLLERALDLPPGERAEFVRREAGSDEELRALVERLLAAAVAPDSLLDGGGVAALGGDAGPSPDDEPAEDDLVGRCLGSYELVRELGRGGMAIVYLGRRTDGQFEQEVAVKVLKRGFETREVLRRFRHERQILAASSHEGLARIFDGGETPDGRPYFVMERVEGTRIDSYCDERRLGLRERVELVLRVAHAVEDAHRRLVVHRDIKPANILVTAAGRPRLLDFGIAKLLAAPDDDATRTAARVMTPAYAAPEQVRGGTVTTATDVYQLGLLLYELATGRLPYRSDGDRLEVEQRIAGQEPLRPLVALRAAWGPLEVDVAEQRGLAVAELRRALGGDLEAILLTALRKEPAARYGSVAELALDLERYLDGRPVRARVPSLGYRTQRFVGRHRSTVAAAALALLLLVAYAVSMAWQARRLEVERDRASHEAEKARAVADFLVGLLREADPAHARKGETTARALLELGAERLAREEITDPLVRARLQAVMGGIFRHLALYPKAEALLVPAVAGLAQSLGPEAAETLRARSDLIQVVHLSGRIAEARAAAEALLALQQRVLGPEASETLSTRDRLGEIAHTEGRLPDAEATFRDLLAIRNRLSAGEPAATAYTKDRLARVLIDERRYAEAETLTREALAGYRAGVGADHPRTALAEIQLARILHSRGQLDDAAAQFEAAMPRLAAIIGAQHPSTLYSLSHQARLEHERGNLERAWQLHQEAMTGLRQTSGPDHMSTRSAESAALETLIALGRRGEAAAMAAATIDGLRRTVGSASPYTLHAEIRQARLLQEMGRDDEARRAFDDLVERAAAALGPEHATTQRAWVEAAACAAEQGRDQHALDLLRRAADAGAGNRLDDPAFDRLRQRPDTAAVLARLAANRKRSGLPD